MQMQQTGVYIRDEEHGWLPGKLVNDAEESASSVHVVEVTIPDQFNKKELRTVDVTANDYDYPNQTLPLQNINQNGHLIVVPDMCDLPSLHEAAILYNLKERYEASLPYTRVGDIVIAMNPFEWIHGLYSQHQQQIYTHAFIFNNYVTANVSVNGNGNYPKLKLQPHLYEVSSLAYKGLALDSTHQSILVSGESGAGKTESVKIIMSHLASINNCGNIETCSSIPSSSFAIGDNHHDDNVDDIVVKRVLDSNPLLEAFGNAKTIRNDNSSRFGKYIQLQFDVEDATAAAYQGKHIPSCLMAGSKCDTYLLEKSRVVGHEYGERTFHIFYQLLAAPEEVKKDIWEGLEGMTLESFRYVGDTDTMLIENKTDGERWEITMRALALIGVTGEKLHALMRVLCTVLQLGNLVMEDDPANEDGSVISPHGKELDKLSELMGVPVDDIEKALTFRTIHANKDTYCVPLRSNMARDCRDAFAKAIYQHAFDWLVKEINHATCAEKNFSDAANIEEYGTIGILDIFGFETFEVNRFEQFSINYANEKLQQKYNLDIFSSVQNEYEYEGIDMPDVPFTDNSEVLHLIEGRMGIISMLNEECLRPHGNDNSFVAKVKTVNKDIECLAKDPLHSSSQFGISHFAGSVLYDANKFVTKNMDKLPQDLVDCSALSSNALIMLLSMDSSTSNTGIKKGSTIGRSSTLSVSSKFRSQLHKLMQTIQKTKTRYVRCIKPNPDKIPKKINLLSSVEQLRCAGVVAAVTISRVSFPNRLAHQIALDRFACISFHRFHPFEADAQGAIEVLMGEVLSDFDGHEQPFACGKTRVYFKTGALEFLESKRMGKLGILAAAIQKMVRGYMLNSKYRELRDTSIYLQSLVRRNRAQLKLNEARKAVTLISCQIRCLNAKRKLCYLREEKACTLIHTRFRITMAAKIFERSILATFHIQKIWRGAIQRPRYRAMVAEAKEEARVNTKIAALQKRLADAEMKWIKADKARINAEKRASGDELLTEEEKKHDDSNSKDLLDESTQMIEFLQQENSKLRMKNHLITTDFDEVKAAQAHLSKQYVGLHDSHEAVKQYASEMSQANMALNLRNMEIKKKYVEAKKTMKKINGEHKSKIQKLKDLMHAKDKDNSSEIKRLQAKVTILNSSRAAFESTPGSAFHSSKKKQRRNKSSPNPKPPTGQGNIRAKMHGRASPGFYHDSSVSSIADEERWGDDGFYEVDSDISPLKATSSGDAGYKNKRVKSPSALPNTSLGRRVVSPDYGTKKINSQSLPSSLRREASTSSLRDALNRGGSGPNPNSRRSSLAAAASKSPRQL